MDGPSQRALLQPPLPETRNETLDHATLQKGLDLTLNDSDLAIGKKYEGKVRDNYSLGDGRRVIVVSDRISAFDRVIGTLPFKGQVLNTVAAFWFEQTQELCPNHVIAVPDPSAMLVTECTPLKVEIVVRAYLTGVSSTSILTAYKEGIREYCGHSLADGMQAHQALPEPIITPTTKAEKGEHDENVSREEIIARGDVTEADFDEAAKLAHALFAFGTQLCARQGLILVDTKYEFGKTPDGRIIVIDEIHTPDSSRFWFTESYAARMAEGKPPESFDKEYVRRWLTDQGYRGDGPIPTIPDEIRMEAARRYIAACEAVMGRPFEPNLEAPAGRLRKNMEHAL